ncbi:MAG: FkbM family methyltransferase [Planctomycetota bacterium]
MWRERLSNAVRVADVGELDRTFVSMVRSMRPSIVTDVGSRDAAMAITCKQASPKSKVFAFEANPENYFEFAELAVGNGVHFVPCAVGERSDTRQIKVPNWASTRSKADRQRRGVGSLLHRDGVACEVVYQAPMVSLADFFQLPEHEDATFAHWIDVEGCSYEVLQGLGRDLAMRTMFLKLEVETRRVWEGQKLVADCLELCDQLGFEPCSWFDHDLQFDIVFANRDL